MLGKGDRTGRSGKGTQLIFTSRIAAFQALSCPARCVGACTIVTVLSSGPWALQPVLLSRVCPELAGGEMGDGLVIKYFLFAASSPRPRRRRRASWCGAGGHKINIYLHKLA